MVHMAARLRILVSGLLVACSCEGNGQRTLTAHDAGGAVGSGGSQSAKCVPGASAKCYCPTGQQSAQTCTSAGTFAPCVCFAPAGSADAGAPAACVPGASAECYCPTGQQGSQMCMSAGTFAACVCAAPTVDAGGVGGNDGAVVSSPDAPSATGGSDAIVATGGTGGSDARAAMGAVGGSDGAIATGGASVTDGAVATGGVDASNAPVATGGMGEGGTAATSPAPAIISFTATPAAISTGQSSTLSWTVTDTTMLSIDQGVGSVSGTTSQVVTPTQTTTYTLTLNGSISAQVTVTVVPLPSITSFGANPTLISAGDIATLTAVFSGGTGTLDQGIGAVTSGSERSTGPIGKTTTYTLTVTNAVGGSTTAQVTVVVGFFTATGGMTTGREWYTATLLPSGMVLIAGGGDSSAEVYDPAAGTFTSTGDMTAARYDHTATLLPSGMVFIAGGGYYNNDGSSTSLASAELYDPGAGIFTATVSMTVARESHTAILLPSGDVLIAGGYGDLASAELYDPAARTFTPTGGMTAERYGHTATLLPSGKVLIAGGEGGNTSAELYDPTAGTFTATGSMTTGREWHTATLSPDGKVLIAGGGDDNGNALASAELYDE